MAILKNSMILIARRGAIIFLGVAALTGMNGCGSSSVTKAGPIKVTIGNGTTSGQPVSLAARATATVSMNPVNDALGAGVDWTAICLGSPVNGSTSGGACGTFSPAHTADGAPALFTAPPDVPIGNTVTITAAATSDPSATSSVTVTIFSPQIAISFNTAPPASIQAGQQATLSVLVTNDSANAGADWTVSCGSTAPGACGSFSNVTGTTTIYTAPTVPPEGPVTITATSISAPTVSVDAMVSIVAPPVIAISVTPSAFTVGAALTGETVNLIATVTNDSSNAGVDWSLQCTSPLGNCGSLTPSSTASAAVVTFRAPPSVPTGGTVTITATATATENQSQPATAAAIATVSATPTISVNVSAPASVTVLADAALTALVTNDPSDAGVTWAVSCASPGACGSITNPSGSGGVFTATYVAPAKIPSGGAVIISATPMAAAPPSNPGLVETTITAVTPSVDFTKQPPASMMANTQATISATVANDVAPGGVTWSVQCDGPTSPWGCGYIAPYQTPSGRSAVFTAPPVPPPGPVTIVAAATATCSSNSCGVSSTSSVTIVPSTAVTIGFVPSPPTQLQAAVSGYLNAAVQGDSTNAGIDWQVCASGCGFFTVTPQIPPPPQMPNFPPTPAVTATTVLGWPNAVPILYTAPANPPPGGSITIEAAAHANNSVLVVAATTITSSNGGPALQGSVQAGGLPVSGSQVALYSAGTTGYGSAATLVSPPGQSPFAITDAKGNFTIPAGYGCPQSTSQMYLVATGGKPGTFAQNSAFAEMTALGSCGELNSSPVVINEVTTVGAAWALAPFAANPLTTGLNSYLNIGSSSSNVTGLANAFSAVNNLVNISNGQAQFAVPAGNAEVPYAEINTLADILNACTVSSGGQAEDGTVCGNLLTYANPYRNFETQTLYSGIPTDTLQAAFEIAQNPDFSGAGPSNVSAAIDGASLFSLIMTGAPFQPTLGTLPFDYSISLNFTGGGGLTNQSGTNSLGLDASGNLWITNAATNSVTEWSNLGAPVTPQSGFTTSTLASPGPVAVDALGNVWMCGENGLTEINFVGTELPGSPFFGGGLTTAGCLGMAMDGSQDIWTNSSQSLSEFDRFGNPLSPAHGYTIATSPTDHTAVAIASPLATAQTDDIWVGVNAPVYGGLLSLADLVGASALPNYLSPNPLTGSPSNFVDTDGYPTETQIAIDGSGNVWGAATQTTCVPGSLFRLSSYKGIGTTDTASLVPSSIGGVDPFRCSAGVAVDGAGVVWTGNAGGPADPLATPPNIGGYNPALSADTFGYASSSLANGTVSVAVDGSGNVWVLLQGNSVTEFIGVATPAVTPLSLAVKNKKLGAKP
jgi:hypothetical protein